MADSAQPSGYHDPLTNVSVIKPSSGWTLEVGQLPDGRFAVDHYSAAAPGYQRTYHDSEAEAMEAALSFARPRLTSIGDVLVCEAEPPQGNPYRDQSVYRIGDERVQALRDFRDGVERPELSFWHAPVSGGARQLASPAEVDWRGMGD